MSVNNGRAQDCAAGHLQGMERRAWVRYPSNLVVLWQFFGTRQGDDRTALVQDISITGLGLIAPRAFPPTTLLSLKLRNSNSDFGKQALVRVKHVTPLDDGTWQVGCSFVVKLTPDELEALLV